MALLAEAKRKVKYGLDPRNTNWSKDDSKFGQKLMEKMGWEKGKGLGAKETGMTEHIQASYKSDTRGLGCTPKDADAWIAHQDDFNDLLKALNSEHGTTQGTDTKEEDKPTTGTAGDGQKRYYGRFARGRVQTLRSTEDLDCIFGKRKSSSAPDSPVSQSATASDEESKPDEPQHGLQTITSSSSVQEYFAKKMAEMKARRAGNITATANGDLGEDGDKNPSDERRKEKQVNDRVPPIFGAVGFSYDDSPSEAFNKASEGENGVESDSTGLDASIATKEERKKKRKKSKKKSESEELVVEDNNNNNQVNDQEGKKVEGDDVKETKSSKKKKKRKGRIEETCEVSEETENGTEETDNTEKHQRKKKKKSKDRDVEKEEVDEDASSVTSEKKKTRKSEADVDSSNQTKGKNKQEGGGENSMQGSERLKTAEIGPDGDGGKKKRKNSATSEVTAVDALQENMCEEIEVGRAEKKKKKNRSKNIEGEENNSKQDQVTTVEKMSSNKNDKRTKGKKKTVDSSSNSLPEPEEKDCNKELMDETCIEQRDSGKQKKRVRFSIPGEEEEEALAGEGESGRKTKRRKLDATKDSEKQNEGKVKKKKKVNTAPQTTAVKKEKKKSLKQGFEGSNFGSIPGYGMTS